MKTALSWPCALERLPTTSVYIYDGPMVKLVGATEEPFAPYQPVIVDRFGEMIIEPTDFLRKKRQQSHRKSWKTAHQYARILVDILYVLALANGGAGIPYWLVTDDTLLRLRTV
ncbi:Hypothetical protein, partial CDS, partial [Neorhizobium galegae bv. officinalis]